MITSTSAHSVLLGGSGGSVSGEHSAMLGRYRRSLPGRLETLADGFGDAVHWAKFDATGKFIGGSEQPEYVWGDGSQSLVMFKGVDPKKCSITVTPVSPNTGNNQISATYSIYYSDYIYARTFKPGGSGTALTASAMDVVASCAQKVTGS